MEQYFNDNLLEIIWMNLHNTIQLIVGLKVKF